MYQIFAKPLHLIGRYKAETRLRRMLVSLLGLTEYTCF
jgi:hypothetical protein